MSKKRNQRGGSPVVDNNIGSFGKNVLSPYNPNPDAASQGEAKAAKEAAEAVAEEKKKYNRSNKRTTKITRYSSKRT